MGALRMGIPERTWGCPKGNRGQDTRKWDHDPRFPLFILVRCPFPGSQERMFWVHDTG